MFVRILLALVCVLALNGCSLFKRSFGEPEGEEVAPPPTAAGVAGEEAMALTSGNNLEVEVAKLNAKIEALETKIEVIQHSVEKSAIKAAQPEIKAEPLREEPAPSLASTVNEDDGVKSNAGAVESPKLRQQHGHGRKAEMEFQSAMETFQKGSWTEAAAKFSRVARENQGHLLAAHSLYWAGEASARAKQWSTAAEKWQELEQTYPTSTYMPEALAGLSRAFDQQGNTQKANAYRTTLMRAFPSAPVALHAVAEDQTEAQQPPKKSSKSLAVEDPEEPEAPVEEQQ